MKFSDYIKQEYQNQTFRYVGEIYGNDEWEGTGLEIAEMLKDFGDDSDYVDHPSLPSGGDGFYHQSGDIWYDGPSGQELVFEEIKNV